MAIVRHEEVQLTVEIVGPFARLQSLGNGEFTAEINVTEVLSVECNLSKCDEESGIFADEVGIILDGTVSQVIAIDDHFSFFDVYIQKGPEFLTLTTDDLRGVLPILDSRIRVRAGMLQLLFPAFL